jgi:stage II sporulation protein D
MLVTAAHLRTLLALTALLCAALFTACSPQPRASTAEAVEAPAPTEDDSVWRHAAAHALGDIEGAVIVMDVQTGRLRAVVNPRLAFEQAFPPGSAIKPFTALAALRGGVATRETRTQCGQQYRREGFEITCSHPPFNRPLTLAEALAHSCNFHFARLGERLSASAFNSTLAAFGFGERTGVNAAREAAGEFRLHELQPRDALGEGERLLVTPLQLITAYAALVNGGHLYRPRLAPADNFAPQEVRSIGIAPAHRAALVEGMRGAVRSGTASRAGFDKLSSDGLDGFDIIGKTGTSTSSNGFRTQGWFVGFAAERGQRADAPAAIKVAVLVFAKRAHGSECAAVARRVIECGVRNAECGINLEKVGGKQSQISNLRFEISSAERVRLRLTRERRTLTLALEDYLRGVLAGEASVESEAEALKAQAVVSRTFALRNLGRHAKEGYDFCDLTHCQHFKPLAAGNQGAINRAAAATEGRTLVDERGRLADVYFHASCGGRTTSIDDLWGVPSPSYLRGVSDEACAAMPHRRWRRAIPAAELAAALAGDERSNVGARLEQIVVTRRDASGRAA